MKRHCDPVSTGEAISPSLADCCGFYSNKKEEKENGVIR